MWPEDDMGKAHITVCICTYKRPALLKKLLYGLREQDRQDLFAYSIVVVDNDQNRSAMDVVSEERKTSNINIVYDNEREQNIARARNKAVAHATGTYVAFIDDDESPPPDWLIKMYRTCRLYSADGVLGPVLPSFEEEPPGWVLKGHFFDRPAHPTGHVLDWRNTRTGNALLQSRIFKESQEWFNPAFGSGGEDRDFFRRKIEEGRVFVWCNEAAVVETVPSARWKRTVLLKRALLRGKMALTAAESRPGSILSSITAIIIYTSCLPFLLFLGHHVFMKYLIKDCDHLGKVLAFIGIDWIREKYVQG